MKLLEEYEAYLGFRLRDDPTKIILTDSEDEFSYSTLTKDGNELIVGYNRNEEVFWRNRPNETPESLAKYVCGLQLDDEEFEGN